jgi:Flp pilus assembly protein TadB
MRCFYHRDVDAVATCKSCGRGLCPDCANDVGNGLACRDRCEAEVRSLNRVIERNKTAYEKTSGAYVRTAAFYGVVGLVFLTGAVVDWRGFAYVLYPASAIFFFSAWLHFATGRRYERE